MPERVRRNLRRSADGLDPVHLAIRIHDVDLPVRIGPERGDAPDPAAERGRPVPLVEGLPVALDLLVLSVEAGHALDQSIFDSSREIRTAYPDLADELLAVSLALRANASREQVFRDFGNRSTEAEFKKLERCLQTLSAEQQQTVQLFYLQQKCYNEIVEQTGLDWKKVRSLIQNGRRNLKICMDNSSS